MGVDVYEYLRGSFWFRSLLLKLTAVHLKLFPKDYLVKISIIQFINGAGQCFDQVLDDAHLRSCC